MLGVQSAFKVDKLNETQPGLADILYGISPSEKRLFRVNTGSEAILLSISNSVLKFSDRELKIITFHDIHQEMDRNEQESWQKLIQILNHEIMNSLAPIISTSAALKNILESKGSGAYQSSDQQRDHLVEKTVSGLSNIHERSEGLKSFVENYKMLNTIPQPVISTFMIKDLFDSCKTLLEEALQSSHIKCSCEINPPGMDLEADKAQILQILINLMKNSIESLSAKVIEDKVILLKAFYTERGKTSIQVRDNGKGIAPELIDQIFIPFFTTRERGSGIGLSLSRQIMHAHHGTLSVYSIPDHITVFTLTF
jgi:signal transduction histidine kinase